MRARAIRTALATVAALGPWVWSACGGGAGEGGGVPAGTIAGTITYDGLEIAPGRPLAIAAYRSMPPKGPPVASLLVEHYELPYRYELTGLPPGTYYVGALIDVSPMDSRHAGMLNARRDPHGYAGAGSPIPLGDSQGTALADIALEDPAE